MISCEFVSNLVNRGGDGDVMTARTRTQTATSIERSKVLNNSDNTAVQYNKQHGNTKRASNR